MVPENVRQYGARGNGAIDDTAAIQRAINNAYGMLVFPPGTYLISSNIIVNNPSLILQGGGVTIWCPNNSGRFIISGFRAIRDIVFDVTGITLKSNLNSEHSTPSIIKDCIFKNLAGSAIIGENPGKVTIKDNFFGACGSSVSGDFHETMIRDNRLIGAPLAIANPSSTLIIQNNLVEGLVFPRNGRGEWVAKKVNFMGDSNTVERVDMEVYTVLLKKFFGFSLARNYGIGGTKIADTGGDADAMVNRVQTMDVNADMVMVMGGGNDFDQNVPLGVNFTTDGGGKRIRNTDVSTFYGALHVMCQRLITRYPDKKIVLSTPVKVAGIEGPTDIDKNSSGSYRPDYVEAMKAVGLWYGIPVVDLWGTDGMQPSELAHHEFYFPDLRHPNGAGHQRMAEVIASFLNKQYG